MTPPREPERADGAGEAVVGCRHVWVDVSGGYVCPGLVIAWRATPQGWTAQVAVVRDASVLVQWLPSGQLRPVRDDRWVEGTP